MGMSYRRAWRRRQPARDLLQALARRRIEHRMQQLIELLRVDALHRLAPADQALTHHLDRADFSRQIHPSR